MKSKIDPEYVAQVRTLIGEWVREFRESKKLTQAELAEMLGVGKPTVCKIETGRWLSLEMLIKLSICLDFYIFLCEKNSNDDMAMVMRHRFKIAHNAEKPIS